MAFKQISFVFRNTFFIADERNEHFYIGRDDFLVNVFKISFGSNLIVRF